MNTLAFSLACLLVMASKGWCVEMEIRNAEPAETAASEDTASTLLERRGALVSFESTARKGQEERAGTLISWEQYRPKPAEPNRPLPPLVLPQEPNFVRSASLRYQYELEEEPLPGKTVQGGEEA